MIADSRLPARDGWFAPRWMWPGLVLALVAGAVYLHVQGRPWWCGCGEPWLWAGDVKSRHNSQHLFDPYSISHISHGLIFYGLAAWALPRLTFPQRLCVATLAEIGWELLENTQFIIERFRATNIAQGYEGDSIANVLGDTVAAVAGVFFARRFSVKASIALFIVTELLLLVWIRDGLTLSIIMLVYPIEALNQWQAGG
jgi:hypothetical protein